MRQIEAVLVSVLLSLLAGPASAQWQKQVTPYDENRLLHLEESRAEGLRQAERGGAKKDLDAIHQVLDPQGRPISAHELMGTWRCRQMKLGGLAPSIVYDWFTCRVRETRSGLYFEKVSGTERISGYVEAFDGGRLLLMGALTVKTERPKPFSGGNFGVGAPTTSSDAVGIISATGPGRARIEFPYPTIESDFDVMELRR